MDRFYFNSDGSLSRFRPRTGDYFFISPWKQQKNYLKLAGFRPRTGDYFFIPTLYSYDN